MTTADPVKKISLPQLIIYNPFPPLEVPDRMIWTSSSVKLFRNCKRKWFWKYLLRLRNRFKDRHLLIGGQFHRVLGHWYRGRRSSMQKIVWRYVSEIESELSRTASYFNQADRDKAQVLADSFAGMMFGYEKLYERDKSRWHIIPESIEKSFKVNMGDFDYAGKIDLVTTKGKGKTNVLVEHKTASKIEVSYLDRLPLDTQVRGYVMGAKEDPSLDIKINHVLYDVVEKCKLRRKSNESVEEFTERVADAYSSNPSRYFYREELRFARSDIEALKYELEQTHREYTAIVGGPYRKRFQKPMKEIAKNLGVELPDPMDPRSWSPNDTYCNAYFKTCEYHTLCTKGLEKGNGNLYEQGELLHEELSDEE